MPGHDNPGPGSDATTVEPLSARYQRQAGNHAVRRTPPSLPTALAGLCSLLGGIGVSVLGSDVVVSGGSQVGAALIALVYGGGGFALMAAGRGPQRAAGAVAVAVAVPLALGFLILGAGSADPDEATLVLALSTVAWAAFHLSGPGRGRPLFLSAALIGAWLTVLIQVGVEALFLVTPFARAPLFFSGAPDTAATVVLSLVFGVVYLWAGYGIHRAGLAGTATPFVGAGVVAVVVGVAVGSVGREAWVPGILLVTTGAFIGFLGTVLARRFTTWLGALATAAGLLVFVLEMADSSPTASGLALVLVGSLLAVATPWLADALGEGSAPAGPPPGAPAPAPPEPSSPPSSTPSSPPPSTRRPRRETGSPGGARRQRPLRAR